MEIRNVKIQSEVNIILQKQKENDEEKQKENSAI